MDQSCRDVSRMSRAMGSLALAGTRQRPCRAWGCARAPCSTRQYPRHGSEPKLAWHRAANTGAGQAPQDEVRYGREGCRGRVPRARRLGDAYAAHESALMTQASRGVNLVEGLLGPV